MYETAWYRGGWHPTRDPTWYGPRAIMLMVLEVNVASICASVPIFWPIVGQYLMNAIFVTHEFSVKYESRENQAKADADSLDGGESGRQSGAGGSVGGGPAVSEQHYKDDFVMQLVDPFGAGNRGTQSRVGTSAGLSVK